MPQTASISFTLTITGALTITSGAPPNGVQGQAYSHQFTATGGTAPYTWSVQAGPLPAGLTLTTGGLLSGTPTAAGSFPVIVAVTDSGA